MHVPTVSLHESPEKSGPRWEVLHGRCHEAPRGRETFTASPGLLWLTPPRVTHAEIARTADRNDFILVRGPADTPLQIKRYTGQPPGRWRIPA